MKMLRNIKVNILYLAIFFAVFVVYIFNTHI